MASVCHYKWEACVHAPIALTTPSFSASTLLASLLLDAGSKSTCIEYLFCGRWFSHRGLNSFLTAALARKPSLRVRNGGSERSGGLKD